jgi:hypothetical protein
MMSISPMRWLRTGNPRWKIFATSMSSLVLISAVIVGSVLTTHKAHADPPVLAATASISQNGHTTLDSSPATLGGWSPAMGVNEAAWDSNMLDSTSPSGLSYAGLLSNAGVGIVRYPGGSTADNFHWYNQSVTYTSDSGIPGSGDLGDNFCGSGCGVNFDQYMNVLQQAGQGPGYINFGSSPQAMITVNYGSGSPQEAADWVAYANTNDYGCFSNSCLQYAPTYPGASPSGNAYGIHFWEIGNEVYGGGTYNSGGVGQTFELNQNDIAPATYAQGIIAYSQAMKAVDPTISIGAVLTAPGNWPDGVRQGPNGTVWPQTWNDAVLKNACGAIDFVDVHWYPQAPAGSGNGTEDDNQLLMSPQNGITDHSRTPSIASMVKTLQTKMNADCGYSLPIMITETNSVYGNPGKQTTSVTNALFAADDVMTWLENGAVNVDWWAGHNSPFDGNISSSLEGNTNFGDFGILSRGTCTDNGACEPPAETPFPSYFGLSMLGAMGVTSGWDVIGAATSSTSMVAVHVAYREGYNYNNNQWFWGPEVLLINKDPTNAYSDTVSLDSSLNKTVNTFLYGPDYASDPSGNTPMSGYQHDTVAVNGSSFNVTVPPYSMMLVKIYDSLP